MSGDLGLTLPTNSLNLTTGQQFTWSYQLQDSEDNPQNFPAGYLFLYFPTISGASCNATVTPPSGTSIWQFNTYGTYATLTVPSSTVDLIPNGTPFYLVWMPMFDPTTDTAASFTGAGTAAWVHNLNAQATGLVVCADMFGTSPTLSAKIGTSTNIPLLDSITDYFTSGSNNCSLYIFGLIGPPTGAQTITLTPGTGTHQIAAGSVSLFNASSFGAPAGVAGTNVPSMVVPSMMGQKVIQAFGGYTTTFVGYTGTQRVNLPFVNNINLSFVMGSAHAPAQTFTQFSAPGSTQPWGGIGVPVLSLNASTTTGYAVGKGTAVVA